MSLRKLFNSTHLFILVAFLGHWGSGCGRTALNSGEESSTGIEICNNRIDDNGDGLVDCLDPQCADESICLGGYEDCSNELDDNQNGLTDCDDPQCVNDPHCKNITTEICGNNVDDDGNGLTDCNDPQCASDPRCLGKKEICDNRLDDDGNGATDCADPACLTDPSCVKDKEICDNNIDDDGDDWIDCKDPDCMLLPICSGKTEICDNGLDDDQDGASDCADSECASLPICKTVENCINKIDDDGDDWIDCKDPDCIKDPVCKQIGQEICNNNIDDDEDGLTDCKDPDCAALPMCQPGKEICDNNIDDDNDAATDCNDPDCKEFPACVDVLCHPSVDFGTLNPKGSNVSRTISTQGTKDYYITSCVMPGGGETVARFNLSEKTDLKLSYEQLSGDHVFALFKAGVAEACNANARGCYDPQSAKTGSFSFKSLDSGEYYLIIETFSKGLEGSIKVTLSTGSAETSEICNNGVDDDGDGARDCADLDCILQPYCQSQSCKYDVNLGTLIINGPSRTVTINTKDSVSRTDELCGAGGGKERVIRYVMPTAAILRVEIQQTGWHVFGVHQDLGPGTQCNSDKGSCFDSNKSPSFGLVYEEQGKGVFYYIVEALKAGMEGSVTLSFSAMTNRGPELCGNEIDDDGDELTDCLDPDCIGYPGCPGMVCVPDYKVGPLMPNGSEVTLNIDTRAANNDQLVPCALGGGKDVVVEVNLAQISGLEVHCDQTGDHVFGLFVPGQPRDPCDKVKVNCADPKLGGLGCHFIMPNLQPGKYYLIVESFKSGSEGTMSLMLSASPDHAQEICNNGIDDDDDGLSDCKDPNCSDQPICKGQTCVADQALGILANDGNPVNFAVTTQGAGNKASTGCAQGGGEDSIVSFSLLNSATIQIDYGQFGNHVFALFENKGPGYACDMAPIACQRSNGQPMGKVTFSGVKAGDYYLVVEAVATGSEGSAVMRMSAK